MTDSRFADFLRLCNQRELAAYRMVGTVKTVINFFEAQEYDAAITALKNARADYDAADRKISEFLNLHKGDSNGNRAIA